MGTPLSKTAGKAETAVEKPGEAAASPTKTNGQVNSILNISLCTSVVVLVGGQRGRNWCVTGLTERRPAAQV